MRNDSWSRWQRRAGATTVTAALLLGTAVVAAPAADTASAAVCVISVANDAYSTAEGVTLNVNQAQGVDANDTLCGSDGLMISVTQPSHGTLSNFDDSGGDFSYTPAPGFVGDDTFTYTTEDVNGIAPATVTIHVTAAATTTTTSATTTSVPVTTTVTSTPGSTTSAPPTTVAGTSTATGATPVAAAPTFTG